MIYYCFTDKNTDLHELAHSLLRYALKKHGIESYTLLKDKNGKPYIENSSLHFSLTHAEGFCAIAISRNEIGIDAEKTDREINEKLLKRICTAAEIDRIICEEDKIKLWTLKEAAAKLSGEGIPAMLAGIETDLSRPSLYSGKYEGKIFHVGEYTVCVCEKKLSQHELKEIKKENL